MVTKDNSARVDFSAIMPLGTGYKKPASRDKVIKVTIVMAVVVNMAGVLVFYTMTSRGTATIPTFATVNKGGLLVYDSITQSDVSGFERSTVRVKDTPLKRSHVIEFTNMPDPCKEPRRKSGVEDLLCMPPPVFLPHYKNPCWLDAKGELRCLPYFHLFGVCKSGTTDLFRRLYLHPDIIPNNGIMQKETWFWSFRRYTTKKVGNLTAYKTLLDFADNFKANEIQAATDTRGYHYKITGHGDPMDLWDRFSDTGIPQNEVGARELVWTSAFLVRKVNPDVKLLLMLRDPIQRLYSIYFFLQLGNTSTDFHTDLVQSILNWKDCLQHNSMRHCIYSKPLKMKMKVPIYSSFYAFHLKEWLRAFPREQMLILRNEDYARDISGSLRQIFTFLNISIPNDQLMGQMANLEHFFQTKQKAKAGPMLNESRDLLIDLYREPVDDLVELLNDARFGFRDVSFG